MDAMSLRWPKTEHARADDCLRPSLQAIWAEDRVTVGEGWRRVRSALHGGAETMFSYETQRTAFAKRVNSQSCLVRSHALEEVPVSFENLPFSDRGTLAPSRLRTSQVRLKVGHGPSFPLSERYAGTA